MSFNLLELHDSTEDKKSIELLRIYSVLPRFSKIKEGPKAEQAIKVVEFLRKTDEHLKKRNPNWKNEWIDSLGYSFSKSSYKEWFIGRASLPLIALEHLSEFGFKLETERLLENCHYFGSSRQQPFKIPHTINENLAYLAGAILCDGHLPRTTYRVNFELNDEFLVEKFTKKANSEFNHKIGVKKSFRREKCRYRGDFANKGVFRFFNKFLQIPRGKKSNVIVVPSIIREANLIIKKSFLEGVFDTDGGKRNRGLGLSSASRMFRDQVAEILEEFEIKVGKDEWVNKRYNKSYYGLRFRITPRSAFLCRSAAAGQPD